MHILGDSANVVPILKYVLFFPMLQLAVMWEGKYKEEVTKTEPLEEVCGELRDELDMAHKQRLDAFEIKMKPIVVREGPSRKVNKSFNQLQC